MLDILIITSKLFSRTSQLWMRSLLSMNHDSYFEHDHANEGPGLSIGERAVGMCSCSGSRLDYGKLCLR
jgi:hypothetical protein